MKLKTRQRIRYFLLIVSFLLFPITLNYFSPYLSIEGPARGIVNGSIIVFGLLFIASLFLGRFWCGWFCPVAGIQEAITIVQPKKFKGGWRNIIKYVIWVIWFSAIIALFIAAGGIAGFDFFFFTDNGISVSEPVNYIIYYSVLTIVVTLPLLFGRRASCHLICWMAPFMIIGRTISNKLHLPRLRLSTKPENCIHCGKCTEACSKSLDVESLVQNKEIVNTECIHCMMCADTCLNNTINWTVKAGK